MNDILETRGKINFPIKKIISELKKDYSADLSEYFFETAEQIIRIVGLNKLEQKKLNNKKITCLCNVDVGGEEKAFVRLLISHENGFFVKYSFWYKDSQRETQTNSIEFCLKSQRKQFIKDIKSWLTRYSNEQQKIFY